MAALFDLLPALYRNRDVAEGKPLERFLEALEEIFEETRLAIGALTNLTNLDEVDEEHLDELLRNAGNVFTLDALSTEERRALGYQLFALYRLRGTKPGIVAAARAVLGIDVLVLDYWADTTGRLGERTELSSRLHPASRTAIHGPEVGDEERPSIRVLSTVPTIDQVIAGILVGQVEFLPAGTDGPPDAVATIVSEYSLDGGYTWRACTAIVWQGAPEDPGGSGPIVELPAVAGLGFIWNTDQEGLALQRGIMGAQLRFTVLSPEGFVGRGDAVRWLSINNTGELGETNISAEPLAVRPAIIADHPSRPWILGETEFGALTDEDPATSHRRRGIYHFEVTVLEDEPLTAAQRSALEDICNFMKPGAFHFDIVELPDHQEIVDAWILGLSDLGVNTTLKV